MPQQLYEIGPRTQRKELVKQTGEAWDFVLDLNKIRSMRWDLPRIHARFATLAARPVIASAVFAVLSQAGELFAAIMDFSRVTSMARGCINGRL